MWLSNRKCDNQMCEECEKDPTFCARYPKKITYIQSLQKMQSELCVIVLRAQKHPFRRLFPATNKIAPIFNYSECDFPCIVSPQVEFIKVLVKVFELLPRTK